MASGQKWAADAKAGVLWQQTEDLVAVSERTRVAGGGLYPHRWKRLARLRRGSPPQTAGTVPENTGGDELRTEPVSQFPARKIDNRRNEQRKKRLLASFLSLVLILGLLPTAALATEGTGQETSQEESQEVSTNSETSKADSGTSGETGGPVQGANSVAYANINAALTAGETSIFLTNDANFTAFALNSGAVTIDLAGHKLSLTGNTGDYTAITVTGGAALTICNTGSASTGVLEINGYTEISRAAIIVGAGSSVTLTGLTYNTDASGLMPKGDAATVRVARSMRRGTAWAQTQATPYLTHNNI